MTNKKWRVGEFWSSADPHKEVLCLAQGEEIEEYELRDDFIRWMDDPALELTDPEIVAVWQWMPGGPDGWLKSFGYIQFAHALIEAIAARKVSP